MPDYRLHPGMRFAEQGKEYVISERLPDDQLIVRNLLTAELQVRCASDLVNNLFAGHLELIGSENQFSFLKSKMASSRINNLAELADSDLLKAEAMRRFHYVKGVLSSTISSLTRETLSPIISRVGYEIKDPRLPSWISLYRWIRTYQAAGRDVRALIPANKARGNRESKISGHQLEHYSKNNYEKARVVQGLIDEVVNTNYLNTNRPSVRSVYKKLQARIIDENKRRAPQDQLPIPHIVSLHRQIERLDPYEVLSARHGRKYAQEKYRVNRLGARPQHPLERVECDHTKLDLMVVDTQTRLPLGRPWLSVMLDVYSRMVLGFYLGFQPPSYLSLMQCLRHAIRPKSYLSEVYPEIEHEWPSWGLPELLMVDNGKEFYSRHFEDACLQLSINIQYAPPKCAWYKGTMERWFGTLNTQLLHELPGTTFSNIFDRGDYDPAKHALISLDLLLELVHTWIIDIYHQQEQRTIHDTPHHRWLEGIKAQPPKLPPQVEELDVLIGCVCERRISNSGIELFTLHYNSPTLGLIRRSLGKGDKVRVKYDPNDLSVVYVLEPVSNRYISIPALDQQYTERLSLWQHKVVQNYARRRLGEQVDLAALCRARERIEALVNQERVTHRSMGSREKLARFLNIGQPDYHQPTTPTARESIAPIDNDEKVTRAAALPVFTPATEAGWGGDYNLPSFVEAKNG